MKGKAVLLTLVVALLLVGCECKYESEAECQAVCASKGMLFSRYLTVNRGRDICLCETAEGEIIDGW